jgi:hypothetical protein
MRCLNCGKTILDTAKICQFCEAPVKEGPTEEEEQAVREVLGQMPPEALEELQAAFFEGGTAEEFANRLMIGPCPKCGSLETGDCDDDPELNEILLARCFECGQFWCTMCGGLLDKAHPACPCWAEEE